ncbi:MAG: hypothetical protein JNM21_14485 [Taibaiella sp.]|nr:hypothetical protein [Taibaiella sp.]
MDSLAKDIMPLYFNALEEIKKLFDQDAQSMWEDTIKGQIIKRREDNYPKLLDFTKQQIAQTKGFTLEGKTYTIFHQAPFKYAKDAEALLKKLFSDLKPAQVIKTVTISNYKEWETSKYKEIANTVSILLKSEELSKSTEDGGLSTQAEGDLSTLSKHYMKSITTSIGNYNRIFGVFDNNYGFKLIGVGNHIGKDNKKYEVLTVKGFHTFSNCNNKAHIS